MFFYCTENSKLESSVPCCHWNGHSLGFFLETMKHYTLKLHIQIYTTNTLYVYNIIFTQCKLHLLSQCVQAEKHFGRVFHSETWESAWSAKRVVQIIRCFCMPGTTFNFQNIKKYFKNFLCKCFKCNKWNGALSHHHVQTSNIWDTKTWLLNDRILPNNASKLFFRDSWLD
jgi:hypothetical protein